MPARPSSPTRPPLRLLAVALLCTTLASGCGARADAGAADVREVRHALGTAHVPEAAERVVALDSLAIDTTVALDVPLVGAAIAAGAEGPPDYLGDAVADVEAVGSIVEPNLEAIAALEPDLVLGTGTRHEELYEQLAQIAPTVLIDAPAADWHDSVRTYAEALGRSEDAEAMLAAHDDRTAALHDARDDDRSAHLVRVRDGGVLRLHGPVTFPGSVLVAAGFAIPDEDWEESGIAELSPERFDALDAADLVFVADGPGSGDPAAAGPAAARLDASQAGVHLVDDRVWVAGVGLLGADLLLDDLEDLVGG